MNFLILYNENSRLMEKNQVKIEIYCEIFKQKWKFFKNLDYS